MAIADFFYDFRQGGDVKMKKKRKKLHRVIFFTGLP